MPAIHVCSLARLPAVVSACKASHLVSLINDGTPVERPVSIAPERHLFLGLNDIVAPIDGMVAPSERHVRDYVDFVARWEREQPMVVHCFAGISRSTAAAFVAACALVPERDETEIARDLRAASPIATPNARLVAIADEMLGRDGRMTAAVQRIGRGVLAYEGEPFSLAIGPPAR